MMLLRREADETRCANCLICTECRGHWYAAAGSVRGHRAPSIPLIAVGVALQVYAAVVLAIGGAW